MRPPSDCIMGSTPHSQGQHLEWHLTGDGLEFKVGGDGAIAGTKKALPTGTTRKWVPMLLLHLHDKERGRKCVL